MKRLIKSLFTYVGALVLLASMTAVPSPAAATAAADAATDAEQETVTRGDTAREITGVEANGAALRAGERQPAGETVETLDGRVSVENRMEKAAGYASEAQAEYHPAGMAPTIYRMNLIGNWNAEEGTAGSVPPGWNTGGGGALAPRIASYNNDYPGAAAIPMLNDPGPADRGSQLFISDPTACNVDTYAYQDIDLSAIGSVIDKGQVTFILEGFFGGAGNISGTGSLSASFLNASGNPINPGTNPLVGNVTAADRLNRTGLLPRSTKGMLPPQTRTVRLHLRFTGTGGENCNYLAYADNLFFMIKEPTVYLPTIVKPGIVTYKPTEPAAPSGTSAAMNENTGIDLWWKDNSDNETGFRIERMVVGVDDHYNTLATVPENTTYYLDDSYPIYYETDYKYRITAFNGMGDVPAAEYTFTTGPVPSAQPATPADCWITNLTPTSVTFGWLDSSDNEEYFDLWLDIDGIRPWGILAYVEPNATYVTIIDLTPGALTTLAVGSVNIHGVSEDLCFVTFTPPALQTNLFRLNNEASYPINSLLIDGVEQLPVYPMNVPPGSYYEIELDPGEHEIQYTLGWWQDKTSRFNMYTFWMLIETEPGESSYSALDPEITDLMTQFSDEGYWEGYYFDANFNCRTMAFRFYSDGSYVNYASNHQIGSGTYSQTGRDPSMFTVWFEVNDPTEASPLEATMAELYGYYYLWNGPQSWRQIQYVYKPQGYVYNPFCP